MLLNPQPEFNARGKDFGMTDLTTTPRYYSRGIAYGDVKGATKNSPVKIARQEFATRIFNAYLDDEGRYCEYLLTEQPGAPRFYDNS